MGIGNGNGAGQALLDAPSAPERTVTYCIVPRDLAPDLYEHLSEHWREDPAISVVVERRAGERRKRARRSDVPTGAVVTERRRIRSAEGRRLAERRALAVPVTAPPLPRRARPFADSLLFFERIEPTEQTTEDIETNRLVLQWQCGDQRAFELLYMRYFERVYGYARMLLHSFHEAEDVAQQVFANVMEALPRYEIRPEQPFRFWLFRITRNASLKALKRSGRLQLEESSELERRLEREAPRDTQVPVAWLSDNDLAILVERLPVAQRQALILRYAFELSTEQIANVMDRSPSAVRLLQHRALRLLGERLTALREPRVAREPMRVRVKPLPVLGARRFALSAVPQALGRTPALPALTSTALPRAARG